MMYVCAQIVYNHLFCHDQMLPPPRFAPPCCPLLLPLSLGEEETCPTLLAPHLGVRIMPPPRAVNVMLLPPPPDPPEQRFMPPSLLAPALPHPRGSVSAAGIFFFTIPQCACGTQ